MFVDFVLNGQGFGGIGEGLGDVRYDPGMLRPYIETDPNSPFRGRPCASILTGKMTYNNAKGTWHPEKKQYLISRLQERGINSPVFNATSLQKLAWVEFDKSVVKAARERARAWSDLAAANTYGGFDGMAKMTLEYEAMSDPGEALVDMDTLSEGRTDNPLFKLRSIPLPITHSDFFFSERRLAISRGSSMPLDTTMSEACARRVVEMVERTTIGTETGVSYGTQSTGVTAHDNTSKVYGYTNHPARITKTNMTVPLGTNPEVTINEILTMRSTMYTNKFYGPYMIYTSTDWDAFLDNDYARLGGSNANMTLRDRIRAIEGIMDVRRLDFLTSTFTMLMVQMTSDVARAIIGMNMRTVQWDTRGGAQKNFKVMCIHVPQIRYDYNGVAAILHGTTA